MSDFGTDPDAALFVEISSPPVRAVSVAETCAIAGHFPELPPTPAPPGGPVPNRSPRDPTRKNTPADVASVALNIAACPMVADVGDPSGIGRCRLRTP